MATPARPTPATTSSCYNPTGSAVDVSGMSVQYRSAHRHRRPVRGHPPHRVRPGARALPGRRRHRHHRDGAADPGRRQVDGQPERDQRHRLPADRHHRPHRAPDRGVGSLGRPRPGRLRRLATRGRAGDRRPRGLERHHLRRARRRRHRHRRQQRRLRPPAPAPRRTPRPARRAARRPGRARRIEEIQGSGATSPLAGSRSSPGRGHRGVPDRRLQRRLPADPGHRRHARPRHPRHLRRGRSVQLGRGATYPSVGDHLRVTGTVSEFAGMTELTPAAGGVTHARPTRSPPRPPPRSTTPTTDAGRESLEGMLVAPQGDYTVTDNYATQPVRRDRPGARHQAAAAADRRGPPGPGGAGRRDRQRRQAGHPRRRRRVNYLDHRQGHPAALPDPGATRSASVRRPPSPAGDPGLPQQRLEAPAHRPADRRQRGHRAAGDLRRHPPAATAGGRRRPQGRQLQRAELLPRDRRRTTSPTAAPARFYTDREGNPVTVNSLQRQRPARRVRTTANLARQRAKIVAAINTLGADVLSLEEIENSAQYAARPSRRRAVHAGRRAQRGRRLDVWAFVPSPRRPTCPRSPTRT